MVGVATEVCQHFLPSADEEDADERPVITRSGQAMTMRSEIDFSFFLSEIRFVKNSFLYILNIHFITVHSKHISK